VFQQNTCMLKWKVEKRLLMSNRGTQLVCDTSAQYL